MAISKFYFYTDYDVVSLTDNIPFGPEGSITIGGNNYDRFRVTEKHTLASPQNAYSICDGKVIYQVCTDNPDLLNIILKPTVSIKHCPDILCFIYRGIKKSSILNSTGNVISPALNTISFKMLEDITLPTQLHLGIELNSSNGFDDDYSIEKLFNINHVGFEIQQTIGGDCLGQFDSSTTGIGACVEVLIRRVGFNPTLAIARKNENFIDVSELPIGYSQVDLLMYKIGKESILNYLDITAFYGNLFDQNIYARNSSDLIGSNFRYFGNNNNSFGKNGASFYNNVLSKFFNKNAIYIDLRNEFEYSFNFFSNYLETIRIIQDGTTGIENEINYYNSYSGITGTYSWPLLKLFYSGSLTNPILKFKLPKGDNFLPIAYVQSGTFKYNSAQKRKKRSLGYENFVEFDRTPGTGSEYNDSEFEFNLNIVSGEVVCGYNKLKYIKKILRPKRTENKMSQEEFIDFAFRPLNLFLPFDLSGNVQMNIYDEDYYVDLTNELGVDFIAKVGIARDANYTYLLLIAKERRLKNSFKARNLLNLSSLSTSDFTSFISYLEDEIKTFRISEKVITTSDAFGTTSKGISKFTLERSSETRRIRRVELDLNRELVMIIIPNSKYDNLNSKVIDAGLLTNLPIFLKANQIPNFRDLDTSNDFDITDKQVFVKYDFQLIGYKDDGFGNLGVVETIPDPPANGNGDTNSSIFGFDYPSISSIEFYKEK